jgi:hypothetical protein
MNSNISYHSTDKYDKQLSHLLCDLKYLLSSCDLNNTYNDDIHNTIYSLKVKEVINGIPSDIYELSEMYINKDKKTFNIYTKKGFIAYPLPPNSIIKSNKN